MKKIYLVFIMSMFLISLASAGFNIQKMISLRDSHNTEDIMDYTIIWGETNDFSESCYIVLKSENNKFSFESKITDKSIISCSSEKNIEIMFNAIQEENRENDKIKSRLKLMEQMLNVSYVEPKEDSLPLYSCEIENSIKECPLGISGGKHTRCYLSEILTVKTWDYCSSGWNLI